MVCMFTSGRRKPFLNYPLNKKFRHFAPLCFSVSFYRSGPEALIFSDEMKIVLTLICILLQTFASAQEIQWASKVINYSSQKDYTSYSANQVLGEPNSMPSKGYSATAWEAATDDRREFLHVGFEKPMKIKQVIIAENFNPGAVVKIILIDTKNTEHEILKKSADTLKLFSRFNQIKIEETEYEVASVKISIDCRATPGINQVDAIGIANHHEEPKSEVKTVVEILFYSEPEPLGPNINSKYTEVHPLISPDGKTLFVNRKDYPPHHDDDEIWYSTLDENGEWTLLKDMGAPLNTNHHNSVNAITPDGNTMLLAGQYFKDPNSWGNGFSFSRKTIEGWSFPENAKVKNFVNSDRYFNCYMSNDGMKIFMNVRREDTRGESDLYVSFLQSDGSWSEPKNLGGQINSSGRECCAFLAADNATLFYASDGFNGFGSSDIYMSRRLDDTWQNWSEPLNLGPPLNSDSWDAYYTIPAKGDYAYYVKDGDIFRIRIKEEIKPQPVVMVYGTVFNQKTNEPIGNASVNYEYLSNGQLAGIAHSTSGTGDYKIILPYGNNYGFLASAKGFVSVSDNLDATELKEFTEIKRDLYLVPAIAGETVRLNNIFFDFGKSELKPESFPELNRVVNMLNENQQMVIALSGHTDNVGSDEDNLKLSQNRINSVMNYLLNNGIKPERMTATGYGESKPVASNDTEEGRADNRRVEFTILK